MGRSPNPSDEDLCVALRGSKHSALLSEAIARVLERQSEERYDLVDRCVQEILGGRAATNFGKDPTAGRALEWAAQDVSSIASSVGPSRRVSRLVRAARDVVRAATAPSEQGTLASLAKEIPKLSNALDDFRERAGIAVLLDVLK